MKFYKDLLPDVKKKSKNYYSEVLYKQVIFSVYKKGVCYDSIISKYPDS